LRAVGSSANCGASMMVLNIIVANQLTDFKMEVDKVIEKGVDKDEAILQILRQYIIDSKNVRFEGNGYSDAWVKEAEKRGLSNIKTTPHALDAYVSKKTKELFKRFDIHNERELNARHDIYLENYSKKIQIESRVMGDLALNHIIPSAIEYQNLLLDNVGGLKEIFSPAEFKKLAEVQIETIKDISEHISAVKTNVEKMVEARKKANKVEGARAHAVAYCENVVPFFETIRYHVDKLELMVDDEYWPLPKYRELLFNR